MQRARLRLDSSNFSLHEDILLSCSFLSLYALRAVSLVSHCWTVCSLMMYSSFFSLSSASSFSLLAFVKFRVSSSLLSNHCFFMHSSSCCFLRVAEAVSNSVFSLIIFVISSSLRSITFSISLSASLYCRLASLNFSLTFLPMRVKMSLPVIFSRIDDFSLSPLLRNFVNCPCASIVVLQNWLKSSPIALTISSSISRLLLYFLSLSRSSSSRATFCNFPSILFLALFIDHFAL